MRKCSMLALLLFIYIVLQKQTNKTALGSSSQALLSFYFVLFYFTPNILMAKKSFLMVTMHIN